MTAIAPFPPTVVQPKSDDEIFEDISGIGGMAQSFSWCWHNHTFLITYEQLGEGTPLFLLPPLSMISSRTELRELAQMLAKRFQVMTFDWPGFGDSSRFAVNYNSLMYQEFLQDLLAELNQGPMAAVAVGHSTGYLLLLAQQFPKQFTKLIAVAPTWQSPFSSLGLSPQFGGIIRQLVSIPLLGGMLYQWHSSKGFIRNMYAQQVYVQKEHFNKRFIAQKQQATQVSGARFAATAFVSGALDLVSDRQAFLALFEALNLPVTVMIGEQTPEKAKAEMEMIQELPGIQAKTLPGSLALHEEYAADLAKEIFLVFKPAVEKIFASGRPKILSMSLGAILIITAGVMAWMLGSAG